MRSRQFVEVPIILQIYLNMECIAFTGLGVIDMCVFLMSPCLVIMLNQLLYFHCYKTLIKMITWKESVIKAATNNNLIRVEIIFSGH